MRRVEPMPAPEASGTQVPALDARAATAAPPHAAPASARRLNSTQLFAGAAEVQIEHRGALYRLKQTALGKLILTK